MIAAVIIDDEQHCTDRLARLLSANCRTVQVVGSYSNVADAKSGIERLKPSLVFLDVHMKNETGFDLLHQIDDIQFAIIFTTAFDQYAVQAFRFSAIDYLLKPIDVDDLKTAVTKAEKNIAASMIADRLDALFHNLNQTQSKKISIATVDGLIFLDTEDIVRCESHINYTKIHLKNQQALTVAKPLKSFEELLTPCNFYRVHNSHLINLNCIKKYNKGKGGNILMSDNSVVEVSLRRRDGFLERLPRL